MAVCSVHGRIRGQEIGLFPLKKSVVDLRGQWDQNFWLRGLESPLKQPYQLEESVPSTLRCQNGPQRYENLTVTCAGTTEWHIRSLIPEQSIEEEEFE